MRRMRGVPLRMLVAVTLAVAPALPLAAGLGASPLGSHAASVSDNAHPSTVFGMESTQVTPEPEPTDPPDDGAPPEDPAPDEPPADPNAPEEPVVDPESPAPTDPAPSDSPSPDDTDPSDEPTGEDGEDEPLRLPGLPPAITQSNVPLLTIAIAAAVLVGSGIILAVVIRRRARPVPEAAVASARPPSTPAKETLDALVAVGEAMIDSGYPSNLVLDALQDIATANEHPGAEIVVFPTALVVTIVDDDGATLTRAVSTGHSAYALHQLDEIDQAVRAARDRPGSAPWVRERIATIATMPAPFTRVQRIGAYVLVSASISVLLGASILGVLLAAALGSGVGTLLLLGERLPSSYRVLVTVGASLGVSLVVFAVARTALDPGVLPSLVAPLVILLPGALLTTGVIELATGHIMSGAARVAAGAMRLLLLAVGIVAAGALIGVPSVQLAAAADPLGPIAPWIAVAVFGVGISINQCARPRSIGWIVLVLYVAYGAQVFGDVFFGGVLSALVGAAVVTPVAVVVAKQLAGPPAIVSFLPAFWLLVPGTLGLVGVTAVLDGDATGASTIVTTISTMIAIALGVLIGLASTSSLRRRSRNLN